MKDHELWWVYLLQGIFLIVFGLVALLWPGMTLVTLALFFTAYIFISGILNIILGITGIARDKFWFLTIALGILELAVGTYAIKNPEIGVATLVLLLGFTFILRGIVAVIGAFEKYISGGTRTLLIITGMLSLLAGVITLKYPVGSGVAFIWIIGLYSLIGGAINIALAISTPKTPEVSGSRKVTR